MGMAFNWCLDHYGTEFEGLFGSDFKIPFLIVSVERHTHRASANDVDVKIEILSFCRYGVQLVPSLLRSNFNGSFGSSF